ncbi:unnamed protein product [Moneuplotes crassus]|uniref:BZIP domain-containing protein n=2 Tax=Euplotes crassus TaxID=5936 RepID=A0AAD1U9G8_EUPCR|nr:unnamed protein product [Moneuplotes crassus]
MEESLTKNNDFLMKFDDASINNHPDINQPDHSQPQIDYEFESSYKEIIHSPENVFENKMFLDNIPVNNLDSINLEEDIQSNFGAPLREHLSSEEKCTADLHKDTSLSKPTTFTAREDDDKDYQKSKKSTDLSVEKKKELNRRSASQCRKRRKEYVEQLERRVDTLENEVHCLKRKLQFYEQHEKLEALSQKESILQYLTGKYDEYDNLDAIIENHEKSPIKESEINKCINTIKIRQSSQGFVRKQTVNYLLKKVIEKIVPGHVKYIVASCANENGYFEKARGRKLAKNLEAKTQRGKYVDYAQKCQDPENHVWKEVIYAMGLNSDEIKLLKKQRAKILKFKDKFSNNLSKFLKIKKEMFKISAEIEKILDDVGTNVKPIQIARFLQYVDKIKHRKEMDVFHLWGVKSNKFRVRKDKIGTQDLLSPSFEKVRPTYALIKKKERSIMKTENDTKIANQVEMNKLKFESAHGNIKNSYMESDNISPEKLAKEILGKEIKQDYKSDDEDSIQAKINLSQNPAFLNFHQESEDSGLPDSACESKSSSDN